MKKDTPNTPDEQLDSLFRQAAAGYEPDFDPEAWKAMERKLDGPSDQPGSIWKNRLLEGIVVLGLLGGLTWLGIGSLSDSGGKKATLATTRTLTGAKVSAPASRPDSPANKPSTSKEIARTSAPAVSGDQPGGETDLKTPASGVTAVTSPADRSFRKKKATEPSSRVTRNTVRPERQHTIPETGPVVPGSSYTKNGSFRTPAGIPATETAPRGLPSAPADTSQRQELSVYLLKTKPWQSLPVALRLSAPGVEAAPEVSKPVPPSPERWALQFMLSPDFTHVQGRAASTGLNTGLQVDYRIAPRWRVSAGVIYSLKNYGASSYDYRPYDGYWQLYHRPDNIDATCKMLDIPVAVTFDAWKVRKNTFFVSVGSTSYVLLKEDYRYQYKTYDYTIEKYNGGNSWLATANLSLGLERPIGPRLTLRAEPFVKLPLGTLGFGNVKLRTEGVFFSLRYRLKSAGR